MATEVSQFQDLQALAILLGPPWFRATLGIALDLAAFIILAFDIRRIHDDVHNRSSAGIINAEKEVRSRLSNKQEDLFKWRNTAGGKMLKLPTNFEHLRNEVDDQLKIHFQMLHLIDQVRFWPILEQKVSTGKSVRSVTLALALFLTGITLQLLSLVPDP